jgi:hypothetical protein
MPLILDDPISQPPGSALDCAHCEMKQAEKGYANGEQGAAAGRVLHLEFD